MMNWFRKDPVLRDWQIGARKSAVSTFTASPTSIISSPESFQSYCAKRWRKLSIQKLDARCKRCCTRKCSAALFKFLHWRKLSILPCS